MQTALGKCIDMSAVESYFFSRSTRISGIIRKRVFSGASTFNGS